MHLLAKLEKLYDSNKHLIGIQKEKVYHNKKGEEFSIQYSLLPIFHIPLTSYIEFVLSTEGKLIDIDIKKEVIIAPSTIQSSTRSVNKSPHAIHDNLNYVAKDLTNYVDKDFTEHYTNYITALENWIEYAKEHNLEYSKLEVVRDFVQNNNLIKILVDRNILGLDEEDKLITKNPVDSKNSYGIFNLGFSGELEKLAVRFNIVDVLSPSDVPIWEDSQYFESHIENQLNQHNEEGFCYITGEYTKTLSNHPKRIRNVADSTKLISIPSNTNFITYQGRFGNNPENSFTIGLETSLKAHAMLTYLISNQSKKIKDRYYIVWSDKEFQNEETGFTETELEMPNFLHDIGEYVDIFDGLEDIIKNDDLSEEQLGREFQNIFNGSNINLSGNTNILVLDSTVENKGRLSIVENSTLTDAEYYIKLAKWREKFKIQVYDYESKSYIEKVPTIYQISKNYNREFDDAETYKRIVSSLLESLLQNSPLSKSIVRKFVDKSFNYKSFKKHTDFKNFLQLSSSVIKAFYYDKEGENYMSLNKEVTDRSYLFGRLVAVAEKLELDAKQLSSKDGSSFTHAMRGFQRMRTKPVSTWTNMEMSLTPYKKKLKSSSSVYYMKLMQEILDKFESNDFVDKSLSGKFLLGYYHQNSDFYIKKNSTNEEENIEENLEEE